MPLKVSALISVYNGESFIERAFRSVFEQDYPVHEIIVIDDGSTDGTPRLLEKYRDRIRMKRTPNAGIAASRNTALSMVTGDLIAFLDHDDVWFRSKTRLQVEAFERFPDVGVVCCDFAVRYALKSHRLTRHYASLAHRRRLNFDEPLRGDSLGHLLREHFVGTPSAAMIRKSVADRLGGFNPEYVSSQDYDYWLRAAIEAPFLLQSQMLAYKYNHPRSMSAQPVRQYTYENLILRRLVENRQALLRDRGLLDIARRAYAQSCYFLGNLHFEKGDTREAFRLYRLGLRAIPEASNTAAYTACVLKKGARLVTFGLLSRKTWGRFRKKGPGA